MSWRRADKLVLIDTRMPLTRKHLQAERKETGTKMALLTEGPTDSIRCFNPTKKIINDFFNHQKVKIITNNITVTLRQD